MLRRIEVRIGPDRHELAVTDAVGVAGVLDIDRVAYRRQLAGVGIYLAPV